eukprot:TRINITY_DN18997_c0_g1_i1.p1 TRINITY_DN18997_c0_g1~~TRINITY_DN18997_c0_g1_i1.p1  ORF type:complete len:1376 (-),score=368.82 TRINITY_DN18997_c0_g1_i1:204-4331(-)
MSGGGVQRPTSLTGMRHAPSPQLPRPASAADGCRRPICQIIRQNGRRTVVPTRPGCSSIGGTSRVGTTKPAATWHKSLSPPPTATHNKAAPLAKPAVHLLRQPLKEFFAPQRPPGQKPTTGRRRQPALAAPPSQQAIATALSSSPRTGRVGSSRVEAVYEMAPEKLVHARRMQEAQAGVGSAPLASQAAMLLWLQLRCEMRSLPCATVALTADSGASAINLEDHARVALQIAVARAAWRHHVEPQDVHVSSSVTKSGGSRLRCDVELRSGASVRAVAEALMGGVRSSDDEYGLRAALAAAGCSDDESAWSVEPQWPLQRLQAYVEFEFAHRLSQEEMQLLLSAVSDAFWEFQVALSGIRLQEPMELAKLTSLESKASFGGRLLPVFEGRRLQLTEDGLHAKACCAEDRLADWLQGLPHSAKLLEKADSWLPHLDASPAPCAFSAPLRSGASLSTVRLAVVFQSVGELLEAAQEALATLDVRWLENTFRSPSCIGYSGISLGIMQLETFDGSRPPSAHAVQKGSLDLQLSASLLEERLGKVGRPVCTEVQLLLEGLHRVMQTRLQVMHTTFRELLVRRGVKQKNVEKLQRLVLRMLDYTHGLEERESANELAQVQQWASQCRTMDGILQRAATLADERQQEAAAAEKQRKVACMEAMLKAAVQRGREKVSADGQEPDAPEYSFARLILPLREDAEDAAELSKEDIGRLTEACLEALPGRVTRKAEDVRVHLRQAKVRCDVQLGSFLSPRGAARLLQEAVDFDEANMHAAIASVAGDVDAAYAVPVWPLERLQDELRAHCRCQPTEDQLEDCLDAIDDCAAAQRKAWQLVEQKQSKDASGLLQIEAMSMFEGKLLTRLEAEKRRLAEDPMLQGAETVEDLLADARDAHQALKEILAPGEEWAAAHLDPPSEACRADHASRFWQADDLHSLPNAFLHDPGVLTQEQLAQRSARSGRWHLNAQGVDRQTVHDISRSSNAFSSPLCLGRRELRFGVRQVLTRRLPPRDGRMSAATPVDQKRTHISELRLRLLDLDEAWRRERPEMSRTLATSLAQAGVRSWDLRFAEFLLVETLDRTAGSAASAATMQLQACARTAARVTSARRQLRSSEGGSAADASGRQLLELARSKAAAAGLSEHQLAHCLKPPQQLLRVESITVCCGVPLGSVQLFLDDKKVGETSPPDLGWGAGAASQAATPKSAVSHAAGLQGCLELALPAGSEGEVRAELCGRQLLNRPCDRDLATILEVPSPFLQVQVPIAIYLYVQLIDEETNLQFVFVCGHLDAVPDEDAWPFKGEVAWQGGSRTIASLEAIELDSVDCLSSLRSLELKPELSKGQRYEAVEWEDTTLEAECRVCQYQRCLVTPVRVGKIYVPTDDFEDQ